MKRFVVGNWKMNLLAREAVVLAESLKASCANLKKTEAWVAPSFLSIPDVSKIIADSPVKLGSQTLHGEVKGAFTGETSAAMLKEFGGTFAIIGHSERRWVLGETDSIVAAKAAAILHQGITPIFCIGESLEEHEQGLTNQVLRIQLTALFEQLSPSDLTKTIVAYEPRWAIGTGKVATPEVIRDVHKFIDECSKDVRGESAKALLYGGSVSGANFKEILSIPNVHGGLIGGASLTQKSFMELVDIAEAM